MKGLLKLVAGLVALVVIIILGWGRYSGCIFRPE